MCLGIGIGVPFDRGGADGGQRLVYESEDPEEGSIGGGPSIGDGLCKEMVEEGSALPPYGPAGRV